MGYWEGIYRTYLKPNESGTVIFYPWGIMGKGYMLESKTIEGRVRNFIKASFFVSMLIVIVVQLALGSLANVLVFPIYLLCYQLAVSRLVRGLALSTEKLNLRETYSSSANAFGLPTLIALEIGSLGFVAAGIFIIKYAHAVLAGVAGILFFGLCSIAYAYMILKRLS